MRHRRCPGNDPAGLPIGLCFGGGLARDRRSDERAEPGDDPGTEIEDDGVEVAADGDGGQRRRAEEPRHHQRVGL